MRTFVYPARFELGVVITFGMFRRQSLRRRARRMRFGRRRIAWRRRSPGGLPIGGRFPRRRGRRGANISFPFRPRWPQKQPSIWRCEKPDSPMCSWRENSVATRRRSGGCWTRSTPPNCHESKKLSTCSESAWSSVLRKPPKPVRRPQRMWNPSTRTAAASSTVNPRTFPYGGPTRSSPSKSSSCRLVPMASTSTRPSSRLRAHPRTPRSLAARCAKER